MSMFIKLFTFKNCLFNTTALISKNIYNILTSPSELVSFSDTSALLLIIQLLQDLYFVHKHRLQSFH